MLGGDEVVIGVSTDVLDVVDDEGVAEGVLRQKDDLAASSCEGAHGGFAYAGCAALGRSDLTLLCVCVLAYRHHHDLAVHIPLAQVGRSLKVRLDKPQQTEPWQRFEDGPEVRHGVDAIEDGLRGDVDGHCSDWIALEGL